MTMNRFRLTVNSMCTHVMQLNRTFSIKLIVKKCCSLINLMCVPFQALYELVKCNYNASEALTRYCSNVKSSQGRFVNSHLQ